MTQFTCKNLTIGYGNSVVTQGIDFSIDEGNYLCIVGENGAGKSTFIKTILGLIPPISGEISMGVKSTDIGYLPQQTQVQKDFPASVLEVVLSGCLNRMGLRPFYRKAEKERANNALEKMGITHLKKKTYSKLSGGQQQRVLLARAFCAANKVLLLDEPATGLDSATSQEMYKLVKKLNDEGMSIIMITHDSEAAKNYADHVLVLSDTAECMTVDEYKKMTMGGAK